MFTVFSYVQEVENSTYSVNCILVSYDGEIKRLSEGCR